MKLPNFILKHPVELVLIVSSTIISATSVFLYIKTNNSSSPEFGSQVLAVDDTHENSEPQKNKTPSSYFIDVSGAVQNPDLYEVTPGARLKDVIDMAGGLSSEADSNFVGRNFNMAKTLIDQEKIYIPFLSDIANGNFTEEPKVLDYLGTSSSDTQNSSSVNDESKDQSGSSISINSATLEELDTLPGVGPVTAQKIIDNRPYSSIDELLSKKAVNSTLLEKLKEFIQL